MTTRLVNTKRSKFIQYILYHTLNQSLNIMTCDDAMMTSELNEMRKGKEFFQSFPVPSIITALVAMKHFQFWLNCPCCLVEYLKSYSINQETIRTIIRTPRPFPRPLALN